MSFQVWSELNPAAKKILKPDLGYRDWDYLNTQEKYQIWKHLEPHFFNSKPVIDPFGDNEHFSDGRLYYLFPHDAENLRRRVINESIHEMYVRYKVNNYTKCYFEIRRHFSACVDFLTIFSEAPSEVVYELLSFYCISLIGIRKGRFEDVHYLSKSNMNAELEAKKINWEWQEFEDFASDLNSVFGEFGINVYLTKNGLVPRQDEKIMEEIYVPVLGILANSQWKEVSQILTDAFADYRLNTDKGFSNSITHAVSAIQAFLQLIVFEKTGVGDISKLIPEAQKKNLIPSDNFTRDVFKTIESVIARERQKTSNAHPKEEYATEKNAKLVLNLVMIFFQHCLTK